MSKSKKKRKNLLPPWLQKIRKRISHSEIFMEFVAGLAALVIKVYSWTLKTTTHMHPELEKLGREKVLYGFWEGRQLIVVPYLGAGNICVLIDASWVGKVLVKILRWFGFVTASGSSKRKGMQGMMTLIKKIDEGCGAAFSLDGPRGPIYKSKPGILFLSQKTGYPISPVATSANRAWILKSTWCHYMIPKPFAKCYIGAGKPIYDATKENGMTTEDVDRLVTEWTEEVDRRVKTL